MKERERERERERKRVNYIYVHIEREIVCVNYFVIMSAREIRISYIICECTIATIPIINIIFVSIIISILFFIIIIITIFIIIIISIVCLLYHWLSIICYPVESLIFLSSVIQWGGIPQRQRNSLHNKSKSYKILWVFIAKIFIWSQFDIFHPHSCIILLLVLIVHIRSWRICGWSFGLT